ncbi:hypothetical protein KR038_010245, partial [Drosophila bunnanda]
NMALSDETNFANVKQIVHDWRETAREKRNMDVISSVTSLVAEEKFSHAFSDPKPRSRANSLGCAERRESGFYHQNFSAGSKPVEIERSQGKTEPDRIRVSSNVNLYLHQPIPLNDAMRASLQ